MELDFKTLSEDVKGKPPTAWQFLMRLNKVVCGFHSNEGDRLKKASNSELKRWCQNSCLHLNGEAVKWDELIDFPVWSIVLFPKNEKQRTTIL